MLDQLYALLFASNFSLAVLSHANNVLSDEKKRAQYDMSGQDPDSRFNPGPSASAGGGSSPFGGGGFGGGGFPQGGGRFGGDISPEELFNQFFGGGGGAFGGGGFGMFSGPCIIGYSIS